MSESRYKKLYQTKVVPTLMKEFSYPNRLAVPKVTKVTVNVGLGKALMEPKLQEVANNTLLRITGQKPIVRGARKSISNFKIKQGMIIGLQVTLRGPRMHDFLDKLINVSLARVRDFQGVAAKSLDGQGNLTIGFKEHIVFPEIKSDEVESIHGLEVTITTSAKTNQEGRRLLELLGLPFAKSEDK
ncbi:MAG: 50S ribosomal protein L5 [Patescibacteria group bacterium]